MEYPIIPEEEKEFWRLHISKPVHDLLQEFWTRNRWRFSDGMIFAIEDLVETRHQNMMILTTADGSFTVTMQPAPDHKLGLYVCKRFGPTQDIDYIYHIEVEYIQDLYHHLQIGSALVVPIKSKKT